MGIETSKHINTIKNVMSDEHAKDYASFSNLHPGYIRKLRERFEMAQDSLTLDRNDLDELFCGPKDQPISKKEKKRKEEIDLIFKKFDKDNDGIIDQYEFTTALAMLCHGTLEEKAELIFDLYDFDQSKYISRDELTILMKNSLTALRSLEGAGPPSLTEIVQKANDVFTKADQDDNERITLDEFKSFLRTDPVASQCLMRYGVAKAEDLGMNFGDEKNPLYDEDLEAEVRSKTICLNEKRTKMKYGISDDLVLDQEENGDLKKQL